VDSDERCDGVEVDGGGMTDVECVEFDGELLNVVVFEFSLKGFETEAVFSGSVFDVDFVVNHV